MRHLFNSKITVEYISVKEQDAIGNWVPTWTARYTDLPCRIQWSSGREKMMFDKKTWYRDGKVFCQVKDITVEERVKYGGKTYQVVNVIDVDQAGKFMILDILLVE